MNSAKHVWMFAALDVDQFPDLNKQSFSFTWLMRAVNYGHTVGFESKEMNKKLF